MALTTADQNAIWRAFIDAQPGIVAGYDANQLRAATVAIDAWITANQANFLSTLASNAAAFSGSSNAGQKTLMFCYVLLRRQGLI